MMPLARRTARALALVGAASGLGGFGPVLSAQQAQQAAQLSAQLAAQPAVPQAAAAPDTSPAFPALRQAWMPATPVVTYTAAEWAHGVGIFLQQAWVDQPPERLVFPKDSIQAAARATVRTWLATLPPGQVTGLQLDPYGTLQVIAGHDEQARRIFAQRLAMPGMTVPDSAFTLLTAVQAFADADHPARLPIAEAYMAQLDALPKGPADAGASVWQFQAHDALFRASVLTGNPTAMLRHAKQAIALSPSLFFGHRFVYYPPGRDMYLTVADLLLAAGDTTTLQTLDQQLLAWTTPPDSLVAADSSFRITGQLYVEALRSMQEFVALWGHPAPPVEGTSWMNVADTGRHTVRLDDGTVHLIGMSTQGKALGLLPAFSRVAAQFPVGVQPLFVLSTEGFWGKEFVTPAQETAHLRQYFSQKRPTTVPIAFWAGEKRRTPDGGLVPAPSPTVQGFHGSDGLVVLVDRQGKIRHFFFGFGREEEAQAAALIRQLLREGTPAAGTSAGGRA